MINQLNSMQQINSFQNQMQLNAALASRAGGSANPMLANLQQTQQMNSLQNQAQLNAAGAGPASGSANPMLANIQQAQQMNSLQNQAQLQSAVASATPTDSAAISGPSSPTNQVTVEKWGEGKNSSLEGILRNQGYSLKEIYAKDANGQNLIDRVASSNGLKNPNLIHPGQQLNIPARGQAGGQAMQPGDSRSVTLQNDNTGVNSTIMVNNDGSKTGTLTSLNSNTLSRDSVSSSVGAGGHITSAGGLDNGTSRSIMRTTTASGSAQVDVRLQSNSDNTLTDIQTNKGQMYTQVNDNGTYTSTSWGKDGQAIVTQGGVSERDSDGFFENAGHAIDRFFGHKDQDYGGESIGDHVQMRRGASGQTEAVEINQDQERVIGRTAGNTDDGFIETAGRYADKGIEAVGNFISGIFH